MPRALEFPVLFRLLPTKNVALLFLLLHFFVRLRALPD